MYANGKERGKTITIVADLILYVENPKDPIKNIRTNKQIQQSCRVQNQYTKICSAFIH